MLIIGATTENPQTAMLSTFLRRIPVHITLSILQERTIKERLDLVLFFLWKESRNIKMRIHLDSTAINAFCYYECSANIGQLSANIKLTCANAYYDYLSDAYAMLTIRLEHLTERIRKGLYVAPNAKNALISSLLKDGQLLLDGRDSLHQMLERYVCQ